MRPPRVRFTVRSTMIAVLILAVVLAGEPFLFDFAAAEVSPGDEHYIRGEVGAVGVSLTWCCPF